MNHNKIILYPHQNCSNSTLTLYTESITRGKGTTYLHNNDKSHLGSQDVPELHCVCIFPLMVWWISIVPVPVEYKHVKVKGHIQRQTDYKLSGIYIQIHLSLKKPFDPDLNVLLYLFLFRTWLL